MKSEPLAAHSTAYDALAGTPVENDEVLRKQITRQIVDTLKQLRAEHGLNWLRKIGNGNSYYDEIRRVSTQFGPNPDLILGRVALHRAYEATAETFIAAYGRS